MGGLLLKPETTKHTEDGASASGRWAYGISSMQGWRKNMEDAHFALPDFDKDRRLGLFGVFDGHGGAAVAKVVAERMPKTLRALPAFQQGRYAEALREAFIKVDAYLDSPEGRKEIKAAIAAEGGGSDPEDELKEEAMIRQMIADGELTREEAAAMIGVDLDELEESEEEMMEEMEMGEEELPKEMDAEVGENPGENGEANAGNNGWVNGEGPDGQGCTAVVALVQGGDNPEVFVANAGDSRCVLARGLRALGMSQDHKPTNKEEHLRILKAGGFVSAEGRVDGNLNLSRALGDFAYKKDKNLKVTEQKISCEAEVRRAKLLSTDHYLILGCDGIFEKVSNQQLVEFLLKKLRTRRAPGVPPPPLSSFCSMFLDANIAVSPSKEQGLGCDNMTLMLVDLHAGGATGSTNGADGAAKTAAHGAAALSAAGGTRKSAMAPFGVRTAEVPGVRITIGKLIRGTARAPPARRRLTLALACARVPRLARAASSAAGAFAALA